MPIAIIDKFVDGFGNVCSYLCIALVVFTIFVLIGKTV